VSAAGPADAPRPAAAEQPAGGVLIVGYGSTLRADDGVGPRAAELARSDPRLAGATVLACHQLTPELAADMAGARLVVLVDARADAPAGSVSIEPVTAGRRPHAAHGLPAGASGGDDPRGPRDPAAGPSTHHVGAAEIAALADALWGAAPDVVAVGVGAASFAAGDGLSDPVERALPAVVDAIAGIVREHGRA
jgi:Ni,Fe-hydrogenase maturation factor